jgi:hypothetical protein
MAKSKIRRKRTPKSVLKLPDLEQSKSAVLNSLTSPSSQRTYDHAIREFIDWYCSEPRLAFNKDRSHSVPDLTRTAALCIYNDQLAACGSTEAGVRGCGLRAPERRSGGWYSPREGCQTVGSPGWQLAFRGAG